MIEWLVRWWQVRTVLHRLEHLGDRMLDDMGLCREDLRERVRARAGADGGAGAREAGDPCGETWVAPRPLVR